MGFYKMKIALCLSGIVGTDDKYGSGSKTINYKIGLKHFKEHVFDVNDSVDVFFHTWSTDYEEKLKQAYNPVSCKSEQQPFFSDNPRQQAIYCRWKGIKEVIDLVKQSGNEYDFILLTRFDIAFLVDFEFEKYDKSKFYVQGPTGPLSNGLELINDLWFFSNQEKMFTFCNLFDALGTENYILHKDSNHELVRRHLLETNLHKDLQYIFKREWTGAKGKVSSDTPLIRWYYMNRV